MNNRLKEAIEKFMVSEPIADLGIVQCTLLQHRLEQFCDYLESHDLRIEKKDVIDCSCIVCGLNIAALGGSCWEDGWRCNICSSLHRQKIADEQFSKKIVGRCVHDHKPITCTGECDANCPHPIWDNARKTINWAFIIEGEKLRVRRIRLEEEQ